MLVQWTKISEIIYFLFCYKFIWVQTFKNEFFSQEGSILIPPVNKKKRYIIECSKCFLVQMAQHQFQFLLKANKRRGNKIVVKILDTEWRCKLWKSQKNIKTLDFLKSFSIYSSEFVISDWFSTDLFIICLCWNYGRRFFPSFQLEHLCCHILIDIDTLHWYTYNLFLWIFVC